MKFLRLAIFVLVIVLILALAAVSVGRLRRNSTISKQAELALASSSTARSNKGRIETQHYRLDSSQSKFIAHALAGGLLWFKGHDHLVAVREFNGEAQITPDVITPASLQITARADSMVETSTVFTEPQKQIIDKELREIVFEPSKYPDIIFRSTNVTGKPTGNNQYDVSITGDLSLHGVTRQITIPTKVTVTGNDLRAIGEFSIDRGDFKVKATSAVHGLVRVRDKVKFTFDIVGHQL